MSNRNNDLAKHTQRLAEGFNFKSETSNILVINSKQNPQISNQHQKMLMFIPQKNKSFLIYKR